MSTFQARKKVVAVGTNAYGFLTGYLSAKKVDDKYEYILVDRYGRVYNLGLFTQEQLKKVTKLENEENTYDYSHLV